MTKELKDIVCPLCGKPFNIIYSEVDKRMISFDCGTLVYKNNVIKSLCKRVKKNDS